MSELPGDLRYTNEHEWLRREEDGSVTIGITDHAQSALGDLVYVELPEVGQDLEAGMNLYGTDMDGTTSPLESGLGWTIAWEPADRDFIGRDELARVRENADRQKFAGLLLEDKGVLRNHQRVVVDGVGEGEITSGGFSPTMQRSIALARLPAGKYEQAAVEVRGKLLAVRVLRPPFVRNGTTCIDT